MDIHIAVIIFTVVISFMAFNNNALQRQLQFNAYQINHRKEWWRYFSHALVHGDYMHLGLNMFVLWSFGKASIYYFEYYLGMNGNFTFMLLYLIALPFSSLISYQKHKDNPTYNAVGASGAVSAIIFACIFFDPWHSLLIMGVIPVPGIVFGIAYLYYSYKMGKQGLDNIGHDAHFWGAVVGLVFPIFIKPNSIMIFLTELINPHF